LMRRQQGQTTSARNQRLGVVEDFADARLCMRVRKLSQRIEGEFGRKQSCPGRTVST